MTHRYNTRFQAKQIQAKQAQEKQIQEKQIQEKQIQAKQAESTNSIREMDNEKNEMKHIETMLMDVQAEKCSFKRLIIATRIFHYLEHNNKLLVKYPRFRNTVRAKCQEFIAISHERTKMLTYIPQSSAVYNEQKQLVIASEEMRRSCEIVQNFLNTIESRPFGN